MRTITRALLTSAAALTLTSGAALAQDNLLSDTLDDVTGTVSDTVDSTVDAVDSTVGDTVDSAVDDTLDSSVGDAGSDNEISDTVGGVTDTVGDVTGNAGDVTGNEGDASVGDVGSFDDVLNSVGAFEASDLADVSQLQIVDVSDLGNFDADALNDTLSGTDVSALQDAISNNSAINDALSSNAVDLSNIVALENNQDGTLVVYTNE